MCCCDGLLLVARIQAEEARLAALAKAAPPADVASASVTVEPQPIEQDHSLAYAAKAFRAWLSTRGPRHVSEAPQR